MSFTKKNIMIFLSVIFIFMISLTKTKAYEIEITPSFSDTPYTATIDDDFPYWYYWESTTNALLRVSNQPFTSPSPTCSNFLITTGTGFIYRQTLSNSYTWATIWQNNLNQTGLDKNPARTSMLASHEIYSSDASMLCVPTLTPPLPNIDFIAKYNIYYTRMSLLIDIESNIYTNQYSYDGLTWIDIPSNSAMTLFFEKNGYVIARVYDSNKDKVINSATFNITQIQTFYNELDEINNKFDNEDLTNPTGFMQMINTFTTDISDSVAVITILSTYTWNSLNGYIKYFILSIGFIVLIVALIKLFLKGK